MHSLLQWKVILYKAYWGGAAVSFAKSHNLDQSAQQLAIFGLAVGSIKAIKEGSSIPVPNAVLAENGLMYKSNSKHTLGMPGNRLDAGIEPMNSLELFNSSIQLGKKRYALDGNGNVNQFAYSNDGTWHWAGRSGLDQPAPQQLKRDAIQSDIIRQFGLPAKGKFK